MSPPLQDALVVLVVAGAAGFLLMRILSVFGFKPRKWLAEALLRRGYVGLAMRVRHFGKRGGCH